MSSKRRSAPPAAPGRPPVRRTLTETEPADIRRVKALWARGDFDAALQSFEDAVRREPFNVTALVDAARAFGFRFRLERTEEYTQKLLDLAPDEPRILHYAGETYRMVLMFGQAIACFERACARGAGPASHLELATLYERQHRLADAAGHVARALAARDPDPRAWLVKARIERRQGASDRAEKSLRRLIARASAATDLRAEAWAELAQLFDASGDYAAAWDAVGQGKQLQLARDAAERRAAEHVLARFARLVDDVTPEHFRRWSDAGNRFPPRPCAVLTGFPRTGTTLLEQVLDAHPGLVSSEEKDILTNETFPTIGRDLPADAPIVPALDALTDDEITRLRADYFRKMEGMLRTPIGDRTHLDKNPAMTLFIPVVARLFPECRFLVALRDPRDVVLSCYLRYLPLNPVSVSFLTPERTARRYALDMLGWLKYREMLATPWAEFRYEDTVADLPATARKALALLDLPWDDRVLAYRDRLRQKPVLSPTYEAVTTPVYTTAIGRWRNYANYLEPVLPMLEPYVREFGYS